MRAQEAFAGIVLLPPGGLFEHDTRVCFTIAYPCKVYWSLKLSREFGPVILLSVRV